MVQVDCDIKKKMAAFHKCMESLWILGYLKRKSDLCVNGLIGILGSWSPDFGSHLIDCQYTKNKFLTLHLYMSQLCMGRLKNVKLCVYEAISMKSHRSQGSLLLLLL